MIDYKLKEIVITDSVQKAVNKYNVPGGWTENDEDIVAFKEEIKRKLLLNQRGKCAYCGLPLANRNPEIDHIAPKGGKKRPYHTECTFLPINLVYACHHCNSTQCKGQIDTVESKNRTANYREWTFKLVHPYLDDPAEFFQFDANGCIMSLPNRNADERKRRKAQFTIEMFGLNTESVLMELAKQVFFERHPDSIQAIITEISTYRP